MGDPKKLDKFGYYHLNGGEEDKKESKSQEKPLSLIRTGMELTGEGILLFEKEYTVDLFNQGIRRGINGNYQLQGRNLSLFGNQTMTPVTRPFNS